MVLIAYVFESLIVHLIDGIAGFVILAALLNRWDRTFAIVAGLYGLALAGLVMGAHGKPFDYWGPGTAVVGALLAVLVFRVFSKSKPKPTAPEAPGD